MLHHFTAEARKVIRTKFTVLPNAHQGGIKLSLREAIFHRILGQGIEGTLEEERRGEHTGMRLD